MWNQISTTQCRAVLLVLIMSWATGTPSLCNRDNVYKGDWSTNRSHDGRSTAYYLCPKTHRYVATQRSLVHQLKKYSCQEQAPGRAEFNRSCELLPFPKSSALLKDNNEFVTLIGDSLMAQLYISLLCLSEQYDFPVTRMKFHSELFMRPDIPCKDQCLTNSTFLRQAGTGILYNPCAACKNGVKISFNASFFRSGKGWPSQISPRTTTLLLGSGAWHHDPVIYQDMLHGIRFFLNSLTSRGVKVYWLDLPPMDMYATVEPDKYEYFGWNKFSTYNTKSREILEPSGVIFLNTSEATRSRKILEPTIASDYMHWCNPGQYSVPSFIAETFFHLIAIAGNTASP